MGDTIKQSGDILIVTGRCSSCGARVAGAIIGAKTDCCATGRLMAWRVQRPPGARLADPNPDPAPGSARYQ
jgi:hypothetical protein